MKKSESLTTAQRALLSIFVAVVAGFFCKEVLRATSNIGDLYASLRMARDLLAGTDPYAHPFGADSVPYPLPAALVALPFSLLPDPLSTGVFIGVSSGLLAWFVLGSGKPWRLALFVSWPFVYCVLYGQWTALLACLWFAPVFMPLVLIKPQTALPMVLTAKPDRRGIILTAVLLGLSLIVYPRWPWVWLGQISGYQGILPPLFVLPLGPALLLVLLRWGDRRAWLVALMALMPQRVVYDQLPLMLVASTWRELVFLVAASWLTLPALLYFGGWKSLAGGWQVWIIATLYIPALVVVLRGRGRNG
jgi:hypothetical protein